MQFEVSRAMKHMKSNVQLHLNKFTRYNPLQVKEGLRLQISQNEFELEVTRLWAPIRCGPNKRLFIVIYLFIIYLF